MDTSHSIVTYKPIPGRAGYEAGDDGSIWSLRKYGGRDHGWPITENRQRRLAESPSSDKDPHLKVKLYCDNKSQSFFVHRLILETFVGPCPEGMECRHLDGNPRNNRLSNLEWATKIVNQSDRTVHGTRSTGEKNGKASLKDKDVLRMVELRALGWSHQSIATELLTPKPTVSGILRGRTWSHLTGIGQKEPT